MLKLIFRKLRNLFDDNRNTRISSATSYMDPNQDEFTIDSLWNNFEKRTWHYDHFKSVLKRRDPHLLNWIGSVDYDGYIRDKCLRYLISNFMPGDENRILLRLADWVPQVQTIARKWTIQNFKTLPFEAIEKNQRLILYLSRKEKLKSDAALQEINTVLLAKAQLITKKEVFALSPMFRRYLFTLSLDGDQAMRGWILEDKEPFNRLLLLNHLTCGQHSSEELTKLKQDKSVFVRRRYIFYQIDQGIQPSKDELTTFALDRNRVLREVGRFYLEKFYDVNSYAMYKNLKGDDFYYIADLAKREDVNHFAEGLSLANRHIRLICLRALAAADDTRLKDLDLASLIAENRKTREVICSILPRILSVDEIMELREAFERSSPSGTVSFLRALERKSFWDFVDIALNYLLSDSEASVRNYINNAIRLKVNLYEKLPGATRDSINKKLQALKRVNPNRTHYVVSQLEFYMRTT